MNMYLSNCSVSGRSKEDDKVLEMLKGTPKFDGERYEVRSGYFGKMQSRFCQTITVQQSVNWSLSSADSEMIWNWDNATKRLLTWTWKKDLWEFWMKQSLKTLKHTFSGTFHIFQCWTRTSRTKWDEYAMLPQSREVFHLMITWWPVQTFYNRWYDLSSDSGEAKCLDRRRWSGVSPSESTPCWLQSTEIYVELKQHWTYLC